MESNIHALSFEVIAYVFEFYVDDDADCVRGPFPLGAVCQTWRQIAWTSPRLWSTFCFNLKETTTETHTILAVEWIKRSGALSLSVTLSADVKLIWKKNPLIFPLVDVINQSLNRCHYLNLTELSSLILSRFTPMVGPGILQSLVLHFVDTESPFDLGNQAAPTKLDIVDVNLDAFVINWTNLTHFHASGLYFDDILKALSLSPQMIACYQLRVLSGSSSSDGHVHSQLQHLHYQAATYNDPDIITFFENATFSNLIHCTVEASVFPTTAFLRFLVRSSCPIRDLAISDASISSADLIEIAQVLPSIISLSLTGPFLYVDPSPPSHNSFFDALCRDSRYSDANVLFNDIILLPLLEQLSIRSVHPFPWKWLPGICHHYLYDNNIRTELPGRVNSKSISINLIDYEHRFVPNNPSRRRHLQRDRHHVDTWDEFRELVALRQRISLSLGIEYDNDIVVDSFEQWYTELEATVGKAPEDIRQSFQSEIA